MTASKKHQEEAPPVSFPGLSPGNWIVRQEMQDMALDFLDPAYYGISVGQEGLRGGS